MNRTNKALKLLIIIVVTLSITFFLRLNPSYTVSSDLKIRMYNDFKSFKEEIENHNKKLASIIIADEYDLNKLLLNVELLNNFIKSKNNAARIGNYNLSYDFDDIYRRYNENIKYLLEDELINETEQIYLNTLYDYNDEIIQEFNNLLESKDNGRNGAKEGSYESIVNDFKKIYAAADEILNSEDYSILKGYRGDFSNFDIKRAEKFIKDIFYKVVPGRTLSYNNMDDMYDDRLIFTTYENEEELNNGSVYQTPQYRIEYDKRTREVYLRLVGSVIPSFVLEEEEIDSVVRDIIDKINYKGLLHEKTVSNISIPQLSSIKYTYISKVDDVWDKQQDLNIELDSYGLIRELRIVDYDDNININYVDINETINHIQKIADVNSIDKIRNLNGTLEYIININYKGTDYNIVIDGTTGKVGNIE